APTQLADGPCFHQYQPLTRQGNADVGGDFYDDHLWLVLSSCAYVKETGDGAGPHAPRGYAPPPARPRRGPGDAAAPPRDVPRLHHGEAWPARPAAHRARRLERLPQP